MEDEAMDLELLWAGPKNEEHLCLGGTMSNTRKMEDQFCSLKVDEDAAAVEQTDIDDLDIDDYLDPSVLGCFLPNGSWGHGRSRPPRRSRSGRVAFNHVFGSQETCTSGSRKHNGRKNNDHWTQDEVIQLVNGVSIYGVGKWMKVKTEYFLTSIRTSNHLKDKWKNLVKICRKEKGAMFLPLEQSLIERIREIDDKDPYPKRSKSPLDPPLPTSPNLPAQWSLVKTRTKRGSKHKPKNIKDSKSIGVHSRTFEDSSPHS